MVVFELVFDVAGDDFHDESLRDYDITIARNSIACLSQSFKSMHC